MNTFASVKIIQRRAETKCTRKKREKEGEREIEKKRGEGAELIYLFSLSYAATIKHI